MDKNLKSDDYGILGNGKEVSFYEKEIWNAAIEAAVNLDINLSYEQIHQIRKLKK